MIMQSNLLQCKTPALACSNAQVCIIRMPCARLLFPSAGGKKHFCLGIVVSLYQVKHTSLYVEIMPGQDPRFELPPCTQPQHHIIPVQKHVTV